MAHSCFVMRCSGAKFEIVLEFYLGMYLTIYKIPLLLFHQTRDLNFDEPKNYLADFLS